MVGKWILAALSCLVINNISAQTFYGKVIDADSKQGLPFASVYFFALETGTLSNQDGVFQFSHQIPLNSTIKIEALGYKTLSSQWQQSAADTVIFKLEKVLMALEQFTVYSKASVLQENAVTTVDRQSTEQLQSLPSANLGEALSAIPGVYNQSTGTGISKPVIRGLSGMRVVTYLNGLRIENQQWGGDHGLGITENGIGAVEVLKGPASLMYGADAMGGVLYFVDEPYASQGFVEAYAVSRFESNSLGTQNLAGFKIAQNRWRVNLFGSYTNQADYGLANGRFAKNSRFNNQNFKASIGYYKKNWVVNLRYNYLQSRIGIPGHSHDSLSSPASFESLEQARSRSIPAQVINNHYALLENSFYFKNSDLKLWLGFTSNQLTEFDEKWTQPGINLSLNNYTYHSRYTHRFSKKLKWVLGYQGMYQSNINSELATEWLIPNVHQLDNGAYTLLQAEQFGLNWQAGFRWDQRHIVNQEEGQQFPAILRDFSGFNYSAGLSKTMNRFSIKTNLSSGFRPPHISELLANGIHHGNLRFEMGDANLLSESATQAEISFEYKTKHLTASVNPFVNYLKNYIELQDQNIEKNGLPVFQYTQIPKATMRGVELAYHWHPHLAHQLHLEQNLSYIQAQNSDGTPLSLIPQARLNTQIKWAFKAKGKSHFTDILMQHQYYLSQNQVAAHETPSTAYHLLNAGVTAKLNAKYPIEFKFGVRNALNENYINHLSRLKNIGLSAPSRNLYVSIKINISKAISHTTSKS